MKEVPLYDSCRQETPHRFAGACIRVSGSEICQMTCCVRAKHHDAGFTRDVQKLSCGVPAHRGGRNGAILTI